MKMKINLKKTIAAYEEVKSAAQSIRTDEKYGWNKDKDQKRLEDARKVLHDDEGYNALSAAIETAEKRCTVRCITPENVLDDLLEVGKYRLTKKAMEGTTVGIDHNAQSFPGAYGRKSYAPPQSTHFRAEYHNGAWIITSVVRGDCVKRKYHVNFSDEAKQAILAKVVNLDI